MHNPEDCVIDFFKCIVILAHLYIKNKRGFATQIWGSSILYLDMGNS